MVFNLFKRNGEKHAKTQIVETIFIFLKFRIIEFLKPLI